MDHSQNATSSAATQTNILTVSGELDRTQPLTELRLPHGQVVRLPTSLLVSSDAAPTAVVSEDLLSGDSIGSLAAGQTTVIPLVEERLEVSRRTLPTGTVRLHKTVEEYREALNEPLAVRTFDIERILLNQPIEAAPAIRHEGLTTIYPLVEEQLILTKQLVLKEEIRVTQRDTERIDTQVVTLRREHLSVERESCDLDTATLAQS